MDNWLNRTEALIGTEKIEKLKNSHVVVFGLGGVGSYTVEGLARAGINRISIVDNDVIDVTNINRQIIADTETVGKAKVDVEENRILKINPNAKIFKMKTFLNKDNIKYIIEQIIKYQNTDTIDYIVDAIDTVSSKLEIIKYCNENNIKLISCMGTGNKLSANRFEITDISKTSVCPLAKVIRRELKKVNIPHLKVLYSKEEPIKVPTTSPASISFVPSIAGLLISGEVVKDIIK